jgi:O-methyltransferase involved in polyketide biosynthesis
MDIRDSKYGKVISIVCGRADISLTGKFPKDEKAEEIKKYCDGQGVEYARQNKYLSIFLGIRSAILDQITQRYISAHPDCVVLHLGCGLDSRCCRVQEQPKLWVDLDFPEIIELRRSFYEETDSYKMIGSDAADLRWLDQVPEFENAVIIAEGFSMFMTAEENLQLLKALTARYADAEYAFDAYSEKAVVFSGGNSVNAERGKALLWGMSNPHILENIEGVKLLRTYYFNKSNLLKNFDPLTRLVYKICYGKDATNRLYSIYHYRLTNDPQPEEDD